MCLYMWNVNMLSVLLPRGGYVVHIFLPLLIFQSLPLELQRGRQIRVTSVIFSVGINEQATLAER